MFYNFFLFFRLLCKVMGLITMSCTCDTRVCVCLCTLLRFLPFSLPSPSHLSTLCFPLPILEKFYFQKIEAKCLFTKQIYHLNKSLSFSTEAKGMHFVSLSILYIFMQYSMII